MKRSGNSDGKGDGELRDEQNRESLPPPSETEAAQPVEATMAEQEVKAGERVVIDASPSATAVVNEAEEKVVIDASPSAAAVVNGADAEVKDGDSEADPHASECPKPEPEPTCGDSGRRDPGGIVEGHGSAGNRCSYNAADGAGRI